MKRKSVIDNSGSNKKHQQGDKDESLLVPPALVVLLSPKEVDAVKQKKPSAKPVSNSSKKEVKL